MQVEVVGHHRGADHPHDDRERARLDAWRDDALGDGAPVGLDEPELEQVGETDHGDHGEDDPLDGPIAVAVEGEDPEDDHRGEEGGRQ